MKIWHADIGHCSHIRQGHVHPEPSYAMQVLITRQQAQVDRSQPQALTQQHIQLDPAPARKSRCLGKDAPASITSSWLSLSQKQLPASRSVPSQSRPPWHSPSHIEPGNRQVDHRQTYKQLQIVWLYINDGARAVLSVSGYQPTLHPIYDSALLRILCVHHRHNIDLLSGHQHGTQREK